MTLNSKTLKRLEKTVRKPELFEESERVFWTDPYISRHILNAHLDPETDDASRKPDTIRESVKWITKQTGGGAGRRLLDLGCGPGLYCSEFCRMGFDVTGIDYSSVSISHSKKRAAREGQLIEYINDDYVSSELPRKFDVVTLIFGDFCVLSNHDRDLLLWKLRSVLNPGGFFIFDVFTASYQKTHRIRTDWYFQMENGFWQPGPHLVLERSFTYKKDNTYLNQYVILSGETGGEEVQYMASFLRP